MKFVIFIVLFLSTILSAESLYVNITKLSNKGDLEYVGAKFKRIGISALYKHDGYDYVLFSGPYLDRESAKRALKKIRKYFPSAELMRVKRQSDIDNNTQSVITKKNAIKQKSTGSDFNSEKNKHAFVGLSFGYNNVLSSHKVETGSVLATLPKEGSIGYTLDVGYEFDNGLLLSLGYSMINNSDISVGNQYLSIKYKFNTDTRYYPYFGFLAGVSSVKWNIKPLQNPIYIDDKSTSMLSGLESGVIYPMSQLSLYLGYTVLIMNHKAVLESDTGISQLYFKRLDNIIFGVQYHF